MLEYVIVVFGGIAIGLMVQRSIGSVQVLLGIGALLLVAVMATAAAVSYDKTALSDLLALRSGLDSWGLLQLTACAYGIALGGLVVGIRYFLMKSNRTQ
jgi:hypothetical protein